MSDPTMQKTGPMTSYVTGPSHYSLRGAGIEYFPLDSPPSPWTEGKQWTNYTNKVPIAAIPVPSGSACPYILVADRSSQSVPPGKTYAFWQTSGFLKNLRWYFEIHGVDGGSTCLPGVGLFNLITNPNKWTYVKPQVFDGTWEISWLSTTSAAPISVSIIYAPEQDGFSTSRLVFAISETPVYQPWQQAPTEREHDPQVLVCSTADFVEDQRSQQDEPFAGSVK